MRYRISTKSYNIPIFWYSQKYIRTNSKIILKTDHDHINALRDAWVEMNV
ncbi:MAG: hypothetical protein R6W85_12540 [Gillisia sp.]